MRLAGGVSCRLRQCCEQSRSVMSEISQPTVPKLASVSAASTVVYGGEGKAEGEAEVEERRHHEAGRPRPGVDAVQRPEREVVEA